MQAQPIIRYNSVSYSVNEGLLQSTITDMAFDKHNFCWLSFPNGIQKFDGKNFTNIAIQPGLPDDKEAYFFRSSNGDLFISHSQGISKYKIGSNRFTQIYTIHSGEKNPAKFIGEDENSIYFYSRNGTISSIDCNTLKVIAETKTGLPNHSSTSDYRPALSDNIINHRIAIQIKGSLYLWDLRKRKLLYKSMPIPSISSFFLKMKTEDEVFYYTNNELQVYNFTTQTNYTHVVKGKDDKPISHCIILPWQNKTLISFSNKLYETDIAISLLKSEMVNFQNQPIVANTSVWGIREDNFGNLYLLTLIDGIKKIIGNNYPVKYYGARKDETNNNALSILPDKINNRILTGTSNGLLIFDTSQRLIKQIRTLPGKKLILSPNVILKNNRENYLLFNITDSNVWELSYDLSKLTSLAISTTVPHKNGRSDYFGNFLFQNEKEAITQSQGKIYRTAFAAGKITQYEFTTSYTMSGLWYNDLIISHTNNELIFLDTTTFKELRRIPFKNTGGVRCFLKDQNNDIYIGSNKGIFKIDTTGKILLHLKKENGLPDECIYAMKIDKDGLLWCSSNKGIFRINKDGSLQQLTKEDGLQENEFNTNIAAQTEDGELFFGGVNGVSSFYPTEISQFEEKINVLFTKIRINNEDTFTDTAAWNISDINLPYHQNSLAFDFIAMASNNPGQYIYQYKMEGIDKEWIQNNELQTVRYYLPPGDYVFKIYASRFFDKDAKAMKEIRIIINPPFWNTWWFIALTILSVIGILFYVINQNSKRKYAKKISQLENEKQLKHERERISKDLHDNLGAYANAVLYNTELLEKENTNDKRKELISDLKFASKDIITSLRETVWALKKEQYTAEDCLVRVRNFLQPFTRYYSHIHFKILGEAPPDMNLHYTKALNLVRIVQESVSNSIKHASPQNIIITSQPFENHWKLSIADDGRGFDFQSLKKQERGNGLDNIEHRAAESGFNLNIQTKENNGTIIIIII